MLNKKNILTIIISFFIFMLAAFLYYNVSNIVAAIILMIMAIVLVNYYKKIFGYYTNMPGTFSFVWLFTIGLSTLRLHNSQIVWLSKTWCCLIGAYISFICGYFITLKIRKNREKSKEIYEEKEYASKKEFSIFYYIIVTIPILFFIIEVILNKGMIPMFSKSMSSYQDFAVGLLHYFTVSSCLAIPISYLYVHTYKTNVKEKILITILTLVNLAIPILIVSRQLIIISIVLLAFMMIKLNHKLEKKILTFALIFTLVGWTFISLFRNQNSEYLNKALEMGETNIPVPVMQVYMYVSMNYDNFDCNIRSFNDYKYGINSIYPIFGLLRIKSFMPQELFETNCDRIINVYNTYPIVNTPYTDGGVMAVLLYMLIIGAICALVENLKKNTIFNLLLCDILKVCLTFSFFACWFSGQVWWFYIIIIFGLSKICLRNKEINLSSKDEDNIKINEKIAILMATYNGEKFLEEQINSILNQTYQDFVLYIRDDNSNDDTVKIIKKYTEKYPEKVFLVEDEKTAKGACKNFMLLLEYVYKLNKHTIFMFSDQDDIWINTKIERTMHEYQKQENKNIPILIHTDLYVVNEKIEILDNSFIKYSGLNANKNKFKDYLVQNNVTGCTMLINKVLLDKVDFKIEYIKMHDWYFALIASAFGKVVFIDTPTINYRQHGNNVVGAKKSKGIKYLYNNVLKNNTANERIKETYKQAESFLKLYDKTLDEKNRKILKSFINMQNKSKIKKILTIVKYRLYKQGIIRIIGEFIYF